MTVEKKLVIPTIEESKIWQFDTYLFDADGVLWRSTNTMPGAINFITKLLEKGKQVFIVTNNSTKTTEQYVKKLHELGFAKIGEKNIVSPNVVMVDHFRRHPEFTEKGVYLVGTSAVQEMLEKGTGATVIGTGPDPMPANTIFMTEIDVSRPVSAVVVGYDAHFSYPKIAKAANYAKNPKIGFFVTNEDFTFPVPNSDIVMPGTGCITAAVRAACLPRHPVLFGKPSSLMSEYLKTNFQLKETIMFGDRLDTDIKFANENSFTSCWMQTGVHTMEDVQRALDDGKDGHLIPDCTYSFHIHD